MNLSPLFATTQDVDCPVCIAKRGEPCFVQQRRVFPSFPLHQARIDPTSTPVGYYDSDGGAFVRIYAPDDPVVLYAFSDGERA